MRTFIVIVFLLATVLNVNASERISIHGTINVRCKTFSEFSSLTKISLQKAITIASAASAGKITEAALTSRDGFLIYEIELILPNRTGRELFIDAGDGSVLFVKEKRDSDSDDTSVEECRK